MKNIKILFSLAVMLWSIDSGIYAQEADFIYEPLNKSRPYTLHELKDSANGSNEIRISITDIQDAGASYVDFYYTVSARLYYKTDDVSKVPLLEKLDASVILETAGKESINNTATTHRDTSLLSIDRYKDFTTKVLYFNKENYAPYNLYDLDSVGLVLDLATLDGVDTLLSKEIYLELYLKIGRYSTESPDTIAPYFVKFDAGDPSNQLKVNEAAIVWAEAPKPSSYEVEWIHIPHHDPSTLNAVDLDFTKNAVRIQTTKNFIPISMLYSKGIIVARGRVKRPVLNEAKTALLNQFKYSNWSLNDQVAAYSTTNSNVLLIDHVSDSTLNTTNWQYTVNYANQSKKKEVIQFFDGSRRNRQSVTLLNDFEGNTEVDPTLTLEKASTVIAQESYYDFNGETVINSIPSPVVKANVVGFQQGLNEFGQDKLIKSDYDSLGYDSVPELNKTSFGAAHYFSDDNQLLGTDKKVDFIPDAEGYPYQRTEYLTDGSGRVKTEYGIGKDLAKDNTKGVRYFYAKPTTSELDWLFGTNIGLANFYKKNISIDPNGLMNIAYIDNQGRTVATSIAGIPENRSQMQKINTGTINFSENLLKTGAERFEEQSGSYELSYPIFVTTSSVYDFLYGFDVAPYMPCENPGICFDCRYQLVFQILDEENELILEARDDEVEFAHLNCLNESYEIDHIDYSDPSLGATISNGTISVSLSAQKQYTIIKKLRPLFDELEDDADSFMQSESCIPFDLEYFQQGELERTAFTECFQEYLPATTPCSMIEEKIKADFAYPNGKFVKDALDSDVISTFIYNELLKVSGCSNLQNLTLPVFKEKFNSFLSNINFTGSSFGELRFNDYDEQLIDFFMFFHPTYCQLSICNNYYTKKNNLFDKILSESEDLREFENAAKAIGFMKNGDSLYFDTDTTLHSSLNGNIGDYGLYYYDSTLFNILNSGFDLSYNNIWFVRDPQTHISYNLLPKNRRCLIPFPAQLSNQRVPNANFDYLVSYFTDYVYDCSVGPFPTKAGVLKLSQLQPTDSTFEPTWKAYKSYYSSAKESLLLDLISSVSCFGGYTIADSSMINYSGSGGNPEVLNNDTLDYQFPTYLYEFEFGRDTCHIDGEYLNPDYSEGEALIYQEEYGHYTSLGGSVPSRELSKINDVQQHAQDLVNQGQNNKYMSMQLYAFLHGQNCISASDSTAFVQGIDEAQIACEPHAYLDTAAVGNLLSCNVQALNLSTVVEPFRKFFTDTLGNPIYNCASSTKEFYNCYEFKDAHQAFISQNPNAVVPRITHDSLLSIFDTAQMVYAGWMNNRLGLNLSFSNYLNFARSCVLNNDTSVFGDTVIWSETGKVAAIKEAKTNISNRNSNLMGLDRRTLIDSLNNELTAMGGLYALDTNSRVGFGEEDMSNNQYELYYVDEVDDDGLKQVESELQDVYFAITMQNSSVLESSNIGQLLVNCIELDVTGRYQPITITNFGYSLLVDRAYRYADGTIWVRLLNASDSSFYNNFYYHYDPQSIYSHIYPIDTLIPLSDMEVIFDREELRYATLVMDSSKYKMTVSTSEPYFDAIKLGTIALGDYSSKGEFPFRETCEDLKYADAMVNARRKYKEYLDGLRKEFKTNYLAFCSNRQQTKAFTNQELKMTYGFNERQFTLYYYDQADNLTMTVPPGGVDTQFVYNATKAQQIENYRNNASSIEVLPAHDRQTKYKYNSRDQVIRQETPNGGTSLFWYDKAGRPVLSQNAEQKLLNKFSYNRYDKQSRIFETGELTLSELNNMNWQDIHAFVTVGVLSGVNITLDSLLGMKTRNDVNRIFYDHPVLSLPANFSQNNLRSRVSTQAYFKEFEDTTSLSNWDFATHFSYDPIGNVKSLLNDLYQRGGITDEFHRFKRMDYTYDVISGNVLQVYYQTGQEDAFYHRYQYDAENRITKVETSRDGIIWDEDANYEYYLHGPLARTELGEHKVQGLDYTYTIQGWLKAINAGHRNADMGDDSNKNNLYGADAFGFALQYNQHDYRSIGNTNDILIAANTGGADSSDLYNGNIAAITLHDQLNSFAKSFRYDQLNRIKEMTEHHINEDSLKWGNLMAASNTAFYDYDANGNLTNLQRTDGASGQLMDDLKYNYIGGTDKLSSVNDTSVADTLFGNDIDNQPGSNYSYDKIGNLVSDSSGNICQIRWYPNGKVKRIVRFTPRRQQADLYFEYDPSGQRIKKTASFIEDGRLFVKSTYYIRDAQGNIMATYEERNCELFQGEDSTGEYYYQYSHPYSYYTQSAIDQSTIDTVMDYLNNGFAYSQKLWDEAALSLPLIPHINDSILSCLLLQDYFNFLPQARKRLLSTDPTIYADFLYTDSLSAFVSLMNDRNEAAIQYLKNSGNIGSFYANINNLYNQQYGGTTQYESEFYQVSRDAVASVFYEFDQLSALLSINSSQYNLLETALNDHSFALSFLIDRMTTLEQNHLMSQTGNSTTLEIMRMINALLVSVEFNGTDISQVLSSISNIQFFYDALNWMSAGHAEQMNALLWQMNFAGPGQLQLGQLGAYAPASFINWQGDINGDLLNKWLYVPEVSGNVLAVFANYFTFNQLNLQDNYFNAGPARPFVAEALLRHCQNNLIVNMILELDSISLSLLLQTETVTDLINYYKQYFPDKVILQAHYYDGLNIALGGFSHFSPYDYAQELSTALNVSFDSIVSCSGQQAYLLPRTYDVYGSSRLGVMDAKPNRKEEANLYSRKLGAKQYELTNHLGSVVATVSDKKLHPQELLPPGSQEVDTTIGYQPEVTGRYDFFPFGMEIQSRSGSFTNVDYTADVSKLLYSGLLKDCDAYEIAYFNANTSDTIRCEIDTNLYGQTFVSSFKVDHYDTPWNGMHKFEFAVDLRLNEVIGTLDPDGKYKVQFEVSSMGRRVFGVSPEQGEESIAGEPDATLDEIRHTQVKLVTFNYSGAELDSMATNGMITFHLRASWGQSGQFWDNFAEVKDIRVTQTFENTTVPLAMRSDKAPLKGFQGMHRTDEVSGSGNHLEFGGYGLDPRLGRRWNIDPVDKAWESDYAVMRNNPIIYNDPDGRDGILVVFPDYKIDPELEVTVWGKNFKAPKVPLGHAGVLLIDNATGETKYYEFGRYNTTDGTKGRVRSSSTDKALTLSNVVIDPETNKPTQESLNKVLGQLSKQVGKNGRIQGAYVEGDFDKMNDYAVGKVKESNSIYEEYNKNRESYSLSGNNCATFGCDVLKQDEGAADKAPWIFNPSPDNAAEEYQDNFPKVDYDPKTKTTSSEIYE